MAPDPRSSDDPGHVGSIIAGHRISLNVHYDNNETNNNIHEDKFSSDRVTPVELTMLNSGAIPRTATTSPIDTETDSSNSEDEPDRGVIPTPEPPRIIDSPRGPETDKYEQDSQKITHVDYEHESQKITHVDYEHESQKITHADYEHESPKITHADYEHESPKITHADYEHESQKITHIDEIIRDEAAELEPESLDSSVPSSSTVSDTRPDTPETARPESLIGTTTKHQTSATMKMKQHYQNGPDQIIPSEMLKTTEPNGAVKLKIGRGSAATTPVSVPTLLKKAAEKFPNHYALAQKKEKDGPWNYYTYTQYYEQVKLVAKAFIKLGLDPYHGVCILGFNSPEWFFADLGAIFAGGFAAGIYTTNSPEACQHCAVNCEAQIWVVEDQKQLDKVLKIKENLPQTKAIIQYSGKVTADGVLSWEELLNLGRQQPDTDLEQRLRGIAINQCCTLIYTSGTTGAPKGVMLSHDNLTWTTHNFCVEMETMPGQEVMISYLPLSHIAAQLSDIYTLMYSGGLVYFATPDALKGGLGATLKECRPTRFLGVPRVWEKIFEKMMELGKKTTGVKKSIATWAKGVGTETQLRKERGDFSKPLGFSVANAIVFKKIKLALGLDRCLSFYSGAAPIAPEIVKYFHSLDILVVEIYGMSETTGPHNFGKDEAFRYGSVGKTVNGCHTKLANQDAEGNGEICMGGRHISMGYLQMPEKTDEAIDDEGWCHSGDIGREDEDGFLYITGRIKELIITAGGENIPPVLIEDILKENLPCISNCMLIGDKRKFLSILLTLKVNVDLDSGEPTDQLTPACVEWCRSVGSSANTIHDVLSGPDANVMRAIQEGIDSTNKKATSNAQRIAKWTILPKDFSIPGDELGPTMKLKRPVVNKKYAESIERFYENL